MISWDELGDFVEKVTGKRSHKGDALPKALFSWDELADFVERVTGKRPHCGDALPKALSGLPEAYDQLLAENKRLREDCKFLLSFAPKDAVPELGHDHTFYYTGTYGGDLKLQERIDGIKAALEENNDES